MAHVMKGVLRMAFGRRYIFIALAFGASAVFLDCVQAQTQRGKGYVREPDAVFRSFVTVPRYRAFLPEEVDLSSRFPVPGYQGSQSSCTAWAVGYAMRSYYEGLQRDWKFDSDDQKISPAYIYNRLHNFSGDCSDGIAISSALELLQRDGAPTLAVFPYSADNCARAPDPNALSVASAFRIRTWRALDPKKLDDAKGQINVGNPVAFGMDISKSFESLEANAIYDDTTSPRDGGHAMVLVGYSDRRQAFKLINSWGTDWGDKGFGWISYRALRELSDRMFVMDVGPYFPPPAPVAVITPPTPPAPSLVVVTPPEPTPVVVAPPVPPPSPAPVVVAPPAPKPPVITPPAPPPPKPVVTPTPQPPKPIVMAPPKPEPAPVALVPAIAAVQKQVTARLSDVTCSRLEGSISAERAVRLRGFAGSADDLAKLQADLLAMPGVRRVESEARLYPWPQCEVFLNFSQALAERTGTTVRLGGGDGSRFRDGDSLSIEVVTPSYPSYLYVSYLQASGEVAHLSWPEGRFPKALAPNTRITFGGGATGQPVYRVGKPFGDEIIVVVASASPLFQDDLPETATDREYLTSFRKAFLVRPKGGGGQRIVSAVAVPLKTQPGN
jgi:hypothetical protein